MSKSTVSPSHDNSATSTGPPTDRGGFSVVLADPPWQYSQRGLRLNGTTDRHYPTMTTAAIAALPVEPVVADNAVLLLWATWPFLPDALKVIEAWGFQFKTGMPWVKVREFGMALDGEFQAKARHGVGFWFRGASEPLLLATRGVPSRFPNVPVGLLSDRIGHSRKPEQVHELAESLGAPRLELFARKPVTGWVTVGHDVDAGTDIRTRLEELAHVCH